uniref:MYND-type domain-containing protein n=1 Tax=Haptolina brevifila TaxID=156173 RepID=A0A7S2CSU9_9EUKA|mmetsp:Transcript_28643/g.57744  ORF Transcript_28643/g.57744 Transcript_28643/m.57744 type:complete len:137 (+) Transcript_28643:215-625(+)
MKMAVQALGRLRASPAWASVLDAATASFDEPRRGVRKFTLNKLVNQLIGRGGEATGWGSAPPNESSYFEQLCPHQEALAVRCAACNALEPRKGVFKTCSACKDAGTISPPDYCSVECQKKHWKSAHKNLCPGRKGN